MSCSSCFCVISTQNVLFMASFDCPLNENPDLKAIVVFGWGEGGWIWCGH